MAKAIVKFYRVPGEAQVAVRELKARGYKAEEISGTAGSDLEEVLVGLWGLDEETVRYYRFGVSLGGVVVGVHIEEAQAAEARRILRDAESIPQQRGMWANSPAFPAAGRMTATDPVDAPMSGDFRKY